MARTHSAAAALCGAAFLAACTGGPQFDSIPTKWANEAPARKALGAAEATSVPSDPYLASLRAAYLGFADFEFSKMYDFTDTQFHAERAMQAAGGQRVQPQNVGDRMIPSGDVAMLTEARGRLMAALDAGAPEIAPGPAGRAVASFDCWLEQQEENIQPGDIAACQEGFEAAMAKVDEAMAAPAPAPVPDVVTLDADVVFDFDKSDIKPAAAAELDMLAQLMADNPQQSFEVQGHTDSTGATDYNQGLSERRAQSVLDYLTGKGVEAERLTAVGFGENRPLASNDTEEGRAQNRRVEIHSR
ncbi:MAG: OmpA family protein [Geminicoccaceae bacterium]